MLRRQLLMAWLLFAAISHLPAEEIGIRAPADFEVALFAGDALAHDIYSMTVDRLGRVVVSGAGYIKILSDDNHDGTADRAILFSNKPASGAHGMLCEGDALYYTGDDGLWKLTDANHDDVADGPPELIQGQLTHREHGANGLARGPDGWLYLISGNDAGVNAEFANSPHSPVHKPNCGTVVRFSPDGKTREIVAHGFRNPYDLCFHSSGKIFTVDADGERDHHLPWYAPTRLFDVATGMHHGWVLNGHIWSWNRPASYFDNVERCAEIDRGSPTGMLCYRHTQFPPKYRDGIFSACWTFGRVYHFPLVPRESTYDSQPEVFLETTGQVGFAPVDMAVGSAGEMYVAIGGRRTRGSVFRVQYKGAVSELAPAPQNKLEEVLAAPQPLDAWSRAKWLPLAQQVRGEDLAAAVCNTKLPLAWRMRSIEIAAELFPGSLHGVLDTLQKDPAPEIVARLAWALGRERPFAEASSTPVLAALTKHASPLVRRAAWESFAAVTSPPEQRKIDADWRWNKRLEDRRVLAARVLAAARGWEGTSADYAESFLGAEAEGRWWTQHYRGEDDPNLATAILNKLHATDPNTPQYQRLLRLLVIKLGDVNYDPARKDALPGYALHTPAKLRFLPQNLKLPFTASPKQAAVARELARLYALTESKEDALCVQLAAQLTKDSNPHDDIHYLMCLGRMSGKGNEETAERITQGFLRLPEKMKSRGWYPSRNWPDRVSETLASNMGHRKLMEVLLTRQINEPAQYFLATRLEPGNQTILATRHLKSFQADEEHPWNSDMVKVALRLSLDDSKAVLRRAWEEVGLRDAILPQLSKEPAAGDRSRFVEALASLQPGSVETAAHSLRQLHIEPSAEEWIAALQALRQACSLPPAKSARQALVQLVEQWSEEKFSIAEPAENLLAAYQGVFDWFGKKFPEAAKQLQQGTGDLAAWNQRLAKLDWAQGDEARGKLAYEKFSCARCHSGTTPLGPDLRGAAGRFSRDDLFTAILDPSRDIAPAYQVTQIETASGKLVQGFIVYESPDSTILTTGPDISVRVTGEEITSLRKSRISFMPVGLLNNASDQEVIDLYRYLQGLKLKQ
jgi:putative membrane-bound dehydrogenase-like protein